MRATMRKTFKGAQLFARAFPVSRSVFARGVGVVLAPDGVSVAGVSAGSGKPSVTFLDHTPLLPGAFGDDGSIQNRLMRPGWSCKQKDPT